MKFYNAQAAFEYYYDNISEEGEESNNTKRILNTGFYIANPLDNLIFTDFRSWKKYYADIEFEWYLSEDRSVEELKKYAKIWDKMHNGDNIVNSNYGWQWNRNNQLNNVISILKSDPSSRKACVTIYDGKEINDYSKDTPCTLNISFVIVQNRLCMNVLMRSNDLWYGFCNDQYCFSKLQAMVAKELSLEVGWYYHFSIDLHIYKQFLGKNG